MTAPAGDDQMRQTRTFPTATPTSPRVLKSADEAPCGSLIRAGRTGSLTVRLVDGTGWHLSDDRAWTGVDQEIDGKGWKWQGRLDPGPRDLIAEDLTEDECRHLSGLSAQEAIAWCEARAKPRPQPGDVVPWAEVEDGALYFRRSSTAFPFPFHMIVGGRGLVMDGPNDIDMGLLLRGSKGLALFEIPAAEDCNPPATLVARDLGSDPEAWRRAMREWTANGNKPARKPSAMSIVYAEAGEWAGNPTTAKPDLSSMTAAQAAEHLNRTQGHVGAFAAVDPSRVEITIAGHRTTGFASGDPIKAAPTSVILHNGPFWSSLWTSNRGTLEACGEDLRFRWPSGTVTTLRDPAKAPAPYDPHAHWGDKRIVDPLRQPGILSRGGCGEATPERVVALARERIEADRREIERLRAANVEARRALETPGRQGLRARLAKAEADLMTQRDATRGAEARTAVAEHQAGQLRTALHHCNEADEAMIALAGKAAHQAGLTSFGSNIPGVKALILTLSAHVVGRRTELTREVFALTAQRDEARRALAAEKVAHTATVRNLRTVNDAANAFEAKVTALKGLLDGLRGGRMFFPASVIEPLRALVPASAVNAEQVVAAVCEDLAKQKTRIVDLERALMRQTEDRRAAEAGAGQAAALLNAWQRWARPLWPEGPPNPADAALRSAIGGRVTRGIPLPNEEALSALRKALPANLHDDPSEGRTPSDMVHGAARRLSHLEQWGRSMTAALQAATERAEKAERNLRAVGELLAA